MYEHKTSVLALTACEQAPLCDKKLEEHAKARQLGQSGFAAMARMGLDLALGLGLALELGAPVRWASTNRHTCALGQRKSAKRRWHAAR